MKKVVVGDELFFKDDLKINDYEVAAPLNVPTPLPILSLDELVILYNGQVIVPRTGGALGEIKIYTEKFGLEAYGTPKQHEDAYVSGNEKQVGEEKAKFLKRAIGRTSGSGFDTSLLGEAIRSLLKEMLDKSYAVPTTRAPVPGKGLIPRLDDNSVLNTLEGVERLLVLDSKVYELKTLPEFISKFERSFEPAFYKRAMDAAITSTPEQMYTLFTANDKKVVKEVLPMVRNKIWHSNRSFKLFMDGVYWVPEYKCQLEELSVSYQKAMERRLKEDAFAGDAK